MIELRKVSVHNLKNLDIDLPYGRMIVFCGRSGSGKSSLAIDTLYAESQRRYVESFSAYTRQFLEKLEKPDAERIDGIPAAIAVTAKPGRQLNRSTVGTATETMDYLRLLFAKIGEVFCPCCDKRIKVDSPQTIVRELRERFGNSTSNAATSDTTIRLQIAIAPDLEAEREEFETIWKERGFLRGIVFNRPFRLGESDLSDEEYRQARQIIETKNTSPPLAQGDLFEDDEEDRSTDETLATFCATSNVSAIESELSVNEVEEDVETDMKAVSSFFPIESFSVRKSCVTETTLKKSEHPLLLVLDRLTLNDTDDSRLIESLEIALSYGNDLCFVLVHDGEGRDACRKEDGEQIPFSRRFRCDHCGIDFPDVEPKLFSFNSPLGACPICEGFGNVMMYDLDLIVPDKSKTIREGAIAPWTTPSYRSKLDELLARADEHVVNRSAPDEFDLPVDLPVDTFSPEQLDRLVYGTKNDFSIKRSVGFDGLSGFFQRLERRKYKMHVRVFLSRWRNYRPCPSCHGSRLRPESLSVRIGGKNIAELSDMKVDDLQDFLGDLTFEKSRQRELARIPLEQIRSRLQFLQNVGLGYLTLSRTMRTLSGGEQRRISLTSALGSSLVDMLYVLDEPSIGLHPADTDRLIDSVQKLRDRGNTVVVVEHEEAFLRAADQIVEIGPGAGESGGTLVFQGTLQEMIAGKQSLTGTYLAGKRGGTFAGNRRLPENGVVELIGCRGNNLKNITAAFPLGMLCVLTGVSGAGKSSLVQETLYPALCRQFGKENIPPALPFDQLISCELIEDVVLVDQHPISRSSRSNPATYLKIFDEIRGVFAATPDAKARNFTAGKFSFNVEGGRCEHCKGDGFTVVDMQFMADMLLRCPTCHGKRYRPEILEIFYRNKNIADVLDMTVREAFGFFRGQSKVQQKLKRLIDVGLDYVRLGQPANTLSGGESQRLKLAAYLSQVKKERSLFILDEPTTGLHFADIVQLLDCFDALIQAGHSLIVIEHNLQVVRAADHVIDLGPGAAEQGGYIVAQGTPEEIAACETSLTGRFLRS